MSFKSKLSHPNKIIIFFIIIFQISCYYSEHEKVIIDYLSFLSNEKFESAYAMLSTSDKAAFSFDDFSKNESSELARIINKKIRFKIKSSRFSETKENAFIEIELSKIDVLKILKFFPELADKTLSEKEIEKIFQRERHVIAGFYKKEIVKYSLTRENNKWKISAGFGYQKRIKELFTLAENALLENNYDDALLYYKNITDFDNTNRSAYDKIMEIEEKKFYLKKSIKAFLADWKQFNDKITLDVEVKNNGTIMIKKVYGKVSFFAENKKVAEENVSFQENIGFNEKKKKKLTLNILNLKFDRAEFEVYAIDF